MIFVILGICVLVASFLIAFVSLIREQSKLAREAEQEESASTPLQNRPKVKDKKVPVQSATAGQGDVLDRPQTASSKPAINRPLFPWEEGKYQAASDMTDADRKKVEMLRAQLAELKSRVAVQAVSEDKPEPVVQPISKPEVKKEQPRLSGEISIADLKRQ